MLIIEKTDILSFPTILYSTSFLSKSIPFRLTN